MYPINKPKTLESVNLEIDNYNIEDLEKLFGLSDKKQRYKREDIEQNEYAIVQKLRMENNFNGMPLNPNTKEQLIAFYGKAKHKLMNTVFTPLSNNSPTTFQQNGRDQLDKTDNNWTPMEVGAYSGGTQFGAVGSTLDVFDPRSGRRDQNEVVRHYDKDFVNTNTSNVYAGVINPLNTRLINRYLTVDSRFRDNSASSSDFTVQLPDKIPRVISMQLASLEIPITYYANSAYIGNTFMSISVTDNSNDITTGFVTIADGTYTSASIVTEINGILTGLGGYFATITVSYTAINGHFTVTCSSGSVASFKMDFTTTSIGSSIVYNQCVGDDLNKCDPIPQIETITYSAKTPLNVDLKRRLGYTLGFTSGVYSGAKSYTSEIVANLSGSRYLFLAVDDFNMNVVNSQFMTNAPQNISSKNILARITVGNGGFLSILSENDFKIITEPRKFFGPVDITRLRVQLYDDYGTLLNMNGGDFSFNMMLEVVYDL